MKRSTTALLIAMAVGGLTGTGIAFALPSFGIHDCARGPDAAMGFGDRGGYADMDRRIDRLAEMLDVTKEQRDAMRAIIDKARPQMRAIRDRLFENRKQLRALMRADKPSESELNQLAQTRGQTISEMIVLRAKVLDSLRTVLTDAQRERLQNWQERRTRHGRFSSRDNKTSDFCAARMPATPQSTVHSMRV